VDGTAPLDTPVESVFTAAPEAPTAGRDDLWGHGADPDGSDNLWQATSQDGGGEDLWQATPEEGAADHNAAADLAGGGDDPFAGLAHSALPPAITLDVDTRGPLTRLASRPQQRLAAIAARTGQRASAGWRKTGSAATTGRQRARSRLAQTQARLARRRRPRTSGRRPTVTLSARTRRRLVATGALALGAVALVTTLGQLGGGRPASDHRASGGELRAVAPPHARKRLRPLAPDAHQPPARSARPHRGRGGARRRARPARPARPSRPSRRTVSASPAPQRAPAPMAPPAPAPVAPRPPATPTPADVAGTPAPPPPAALPEVP